jgi:hypothetical protein
VFEYRHVGELIGVRPQARLLLPADRPLSYLRVAAIEPGGLDRSTGVTRALLEQRASEFRIRIPFLGERERVAEALDRFAVSGVFPALVGRQAGNDGEVDVCWLDWVQLRAVGRDFEAGFEASRGAVSIADLELSHAYASVAAEEGEPVDRTWQYWNSSWEFTAPPPERAGWWRVRPNESRNRSSSGLRKAEAGFGPQARGTFAACLHPEMSEMLKGPRYVVVRHPHRNGWLPVRVLDFDNTEAEEDEWRETIFLDRTARDALGIADGEFCFVYPWLRPRRSVWWRAFRDRAVGSRTIAAHVRAPPGRTWRSRFAAWSRQPWRQSGDDPENSS